MTPRRLTTRRAGFILVATALVVGALALEDRASVERGNRAFHAGDRETAAQTYARLSEDPAVAYNLGIVFADLNRPVEARRYLGQYLRLAPPDHPGRTRAAEILAEVDQRERTR